jgi:hypothetical protein
VVYDPKTRKAQGEKWNNYTDKLPHTWNENTDNVAVTGICMLNASPGDFGACPINEVIINEMCLCAAEICALKGMKPEDWKTHAERAIAQGYGPLSGDPFTKWDLSLFSPKRWASKAEAEKDTRAHGDTMRARIKARLVEIVGGSRKVRAWHLVSV